ncbi:hypothetical protein [Algirhabdus cladophorae]|uniref:hypothetical protein n=1 Tax=Algirhabdus cladophorae TaxID=3377108 RepID=UPI003B846018
MLMQKGFAKEAGEHAVIWIDPARVTHHASSKWPVTNHRIARAQTLLPKFVVNMLRPTLRKYEPLLTPRKLFDVSGPIKEAPKFQRVADFVAHKETPEKSIWYQNLAAQLAKTGIAKHKDIEMRSSSEIDTFFETYVEPLIKDLAKNGYVPDHTGFESTAVIAQDGTLIKSGSGNHRFYICKILGIRRFPLRIVGMHEDYFKAHARTETITADAVIDLLGPVEARHRAQ